MTALIFTKIESTPYVLTMSARIPRDPPPLSGRVIAIGSTTVISTTTTNPQGAQTTEQLPRTLFTLAVDQAQAEKIMLATRTGELSFGYLNDKSEVQAGPGTTAQNLFR